MIFTGIVDLSTGRIYCLEQLIDFFVTHFFPQIRQNCASFNQRHSSYHEQNLNPRKRAKGENLWQRKTYYIVIAQHR